jgi:hypothetical protein
MPKRLGIVVPYRNRSTHLAEFIPYITEFFRSDPSNKDIPCRVLITEQAPGLPFNRGLLKNIGFTYLRPETDYICFHDVDWLPVDADYHWAEAPTQIIFHGLPFTEDFILKILFGGAVLLTNSHYAMLNGYSNEYWGWGFEDVDLRERISYSKLQRAYRRGTFRALAHQDEGVNPQGKPSIAFYETQKIFINRWLKPARNGWRQRQFPHDWHRDGLSTLAFDEVSPRRVIQPAENGAPLFEHVTVAPRLVYPVSTV